MDKAVTPPENIASRRRFLGFAALGAGALALPGCASYGGFSYTAIMFERYQLRPKPGGDPFQLFSGSNAQQASLLNKSSRSTCFIFFGIQCSMRTL